LIYWELSSTSGLISLMPVAKDGLLYVGAGYHYDPLYAIRPGAATDDNCLIFQTRQLDDNDRVWVESVERQGNEFTIVMKEAIWQGYYYKTFTGYEVLVVNLGKLPKEPPAASTPKEHDLVFSIDGSITD